MATDYEKLYRKQRNALGDPTKKIVDFFTTRQKLNSRVLDVGCGQGRDALFIARLGFRVVGVDISPSGISDMLAQSADENLGIIGDVADITKYIPDGKFDIVLLDRTLHMLSEVDMLRVLTTLINHVDEDGYVLIDDERANMAGFHRVLQDSKSDWNIISQTGNFLIAHKAG